MAQILVRNLEDGVKDRLRRRAERHHHSLEAEARAILSAAVTDDDPVLAWLDDSAALRAEHGGVDLPLPERSAPRRVDPL